MGRRLEDCQVLSSRWCAGEDPRSAEISRFRLAWFVALAGLAGAGCWPADDPCLWNKFCHDPHPQTCTIESRHFRAGQVDPENPCLTCQPQVSTDSWTALPEGEACGAGRVCNTSATCLNADGQSCVTGADCASGSCGKFYQDQDGDGEGVYDPTWLCGAAPPQGYAAVGGDCCDQDANAYSKQKAFFTVMNACGSWDYSCTHTIDPQPPIHSAGCEGPSGPDPCVGQTVRTGWCYAYDHSTLGTVCINVLPWEVQMPTCGASGPFLVSGGSCAFDEYLGCVVVTQGAEIETRTAACR